MVTRNFLNLLAMLLQGGSNVGGLPARDVTGNVCYLSGTYSFPYNTSTSVTTNANANGISVGTGNAAATEDDYQLARPLTSGISLSLSEKLFGVDSPGFPYVQYKVTVTNNGSESVTVKEIGYKQSCGMTKYPGSSAAGTTKVFLLDRTVLDVPVTVAAGDAGIITYKLRTIPRAYEEIGGVQTASFDSASDAEITAMLDAAAAGDIDLQTDAGWRVGDKRKIHLEAWVGGNNVSHAAEDLYIMITSFAEYNGCGNVLQFDFVDCCAASQRMNSTSTTTGGYGASEMYTVTLPAMVEALPSWLKSRLKTFPVLASKGGSEMSTIETVSGNKLALRASVEIFGVDANGQPGEGVQVEYYKNASARIKVQGTSTGTASGGTIWHLRSAHTTSAFCTVTGDGGASDSSATQARGLSPFGCI